MTATDNQFPNSGRGAVTADLNAFAQTSHRVNPRLEKRLKDFATGGLLLIWKRQSMYFIAALLAALYVDLWLAITCLLLCEASELYDYRVSKAVSEWEDGTHREAEAFRRRLLLTSIFNALSVSAFCVGFALFEGPVPHQLPLFILFSAGLFAAVNNHQIPQVLYSRLVVYGAAFLFIPLYDLWVVRPPLESVLWLQFATVVFVLYFVVECAQIFLKLYRGGLDQMDALREERDRARAAYEVKAQFVSIVSHELRTPLTSIAGSLDLLGSGLVDGLSERAKRIVEIAGQNSMRLKALIDDLLDLQKLESGNIQYRMKRENLQDLAGEAIRSITVVADKRGIVIENESPDPAIVVKADHARLMQVFANLLSNAIKFSRGAGTVSVSIWKDAQYAYASVADAGIGIPEGSEGVVFGRFGQVDSSDHRRHEGTGLGLNIVQQIIEAHGGHISYRSEVGKGTTFTLQLPLESECPDPETNDDRVSQAAQDLSSQAEDRDRDATLQDGGAIKMEGENA